MYTAQNIPEYFGVHWWHQHKNCSFFIPGELGKASSAKLIMSTWSFEHVKEIRFNDEKLREHVGLIHEYSLDVLPIPLNVLKKGDNIFAIFNDDQNHPAEVNWPGPVLLVEYDR